ncbi:glycosyltransferase family 2 protein [Sphingomonas sp. UYP23]
MHFDAGRRAPRAYMTALWWRLLGKRLRARSQFAPLLMKSPRAYSLWLESEPRIDAYTDCFRRIIALVDASGDQSASARGAVQRTLDSLSTEGIAAFVVGTSRIPDLGAVARRIDWGEAVWLLPIPAGDVVAPAAGDAYRRAIGAADSRVIYADDDLYDDRRRRTSPHLKPDWNAELFNHFDYLSGACIVCATEQDLENNSGPLWVPHLTASIAAASATVPRHLPYVLHHRLSRPSPTIPASFDTGHAETPSVSVIVPTRNRIDLLHTCLQGLEQTDYPNLEIIVVDNDSDDPATLAYLAALPAPRYRVERYVGAFNFSAINNLAAQSARGDVLCLLNNDIEVRAPGWLKTMVRQALRPEVGAVGAQLLYPDGRIQHAGVTLGIGGGAGHSHRFLYPDDVGYFSRHAVPQFVSAVTAACLVVQRSRFHAVGGLDEENFAVAFNDVDLCMRLKRRGWQSLYEPRAMLVHHESVSRGLDRDPIGARRFAGEFAALRRLWVDGKPLDPFFHPNLSPFSERFALNL